MNPPYVRCILCGFPIRKMTEVKYMTWINEFRAVYSGPSGGCVSGVAFYNPTSLDRVLVPSDPSRHWNDDDKPPKSWVDLRVMCSSTRECPEGFAFHDACWSLLQHARHPVGIEVQRLLEICESMPRPNNNRGFFGNYAYGGSFEHQSKDLYPWEMRDFVASYVSALSLYATANPYDVSKISDFLAMRPESQFGPFPAPELPDCFSRLPWEILEGIGSELSTRDALSLRLVSKAFLPLLKSAYFWSSRFQYNGECDFVVETRGRREQTDWLNLYRLTVHDASSGGLQNRRRIWGLTKQIISLLDLRPLEELEWLDEQQQLHPGWTSVSGDLRNEPWGQYFTPDFGGCQILDTQLARVPKSLSEIRFSISTIGQTDFVSGLRLLTENSSCTCLGYVSANEEIRCKVSELSGFIVAASALGINAIKVVNGDGTISEWIGRPKDWPVTERLASFESIAALEVKVDGFKIVSLAIAGDKFPLCPDIKERPLRETALWYPRMPQEGLCLNEHSFTGESPFDFSYRPLCWVHFGGPGGIHLRKLAGVTVSISFGLESMLFHYKPYDSFQGDKRLGRRSFIYMEDDQFFSIDGAGGEVIESVEVEFEDAEPYGEFQPRYSFLGRGWLRAVNLTTNWNRTYYADFGHEPLSNREDATKTTVYPLSIAPGTTLTGFYGTVSPGYNIISLGAISEKIESI